MGYNDIRVNKEEKKKAMARVTEMSTKVSELEKAHSKKESELETDLDAERTRAINAEKAAEELRKEVDGIKKKCSEQKDENMTKGISMYIHLA